MASNNMYFNERDAQIGDLFYEVGYEEVWKVTESCVNNNGVQGCCAVVVGYRNNNNRDECWTVGHTSFWGYANGWHGSNLVRVKTFTTQG